MSRAIRILAMLAIFMVVSAGPLWAPEPIDRDDGPFGGGGGVPEAPLKSSEFDSIAPELKEPYVAAMSDYYVAYSKELTDIELSMSHKQETLRWKRTSSMIIFYFVIVITLFGLLLCWLQFRVNIKRPSATEFAVSRDGLKVSTRVLGVVVLLISLVFFYLYLRHVYPITVLRGADSSVAGVESQPDTQGRESRP